MGSPFIDIPINEALINVINSVLKTYSVKVGRTLVGIADMECTNGFQLQEDVYISV